MIDGCPFCRYQGPSPLLLDFGDTYIIEPTEPVVPGHVLVVPFAHHEHAVAAPSVFARAAYVAARYAREADLGACNIITNCGAAASQSVNHLHLHVLPRVPGDGLLLPWSLRCCVNHTVHCEPPSELCCNACPEARHPDHPPGAPCVLEVAR